MFQSDRILVVEDNPEQGELICKVLSEGRVTNRVFAVGSGEEAVAYLSGQGVFANRDTYPLPTLLLLDLKLPGISGFEVLNWVRTNPAVSRMPVVVLTGTMQDGNIERAYALGANSYLLKPFGMDELRTMVKSINAYWVILAAKPAV